MKKLVLGLATSLLCFGSVSADIGVNIGVSGQAGVFSASVSETDKGTHGTTTGGDEVENANDLLAIGYASIFIEKTLGRFFVGVDYVPDDLKTETMEHAITDYTDRTAGTGVTTTTNKVQVDFADLTTAYIGLSLGNAYIKAGVVSVDIITNENMASGVTYANSSTDGSMVGMGYNHSFDNGMFIRGESTYMDFDAASVTSSNSATVINMRSLDGVSGKISIGKSF